MTPDDLAAELDGLLSAVHDMNGAAVRVLVAEERFERMHSRFRGTLSNRKPDSQTAAAQPRSTGGTPPRGV